MPYSDPIIASQKAKERYHLNREVILARARERVKDPEFQRKRKAWRAANKHKIRKCGNAWYAKNKIELRARVRKSRAARRAELSAKLKHQYRNDIHFRIMCVYRSRILSVLRAKGARKTCKAKEMLGCSIEFFRSHIENAWLQGMNWGNHGNHDGEWEIDHIIPCASFDLSVPEQQAKCFHWSNHQPLWQEVNRAKWKHLNFEVAA